VGPLGIAFTSGGGVIATDQLGNVRTFPADADGQSAAWYPPGANYGFRNAHGLTQDATGDTYYLTQAPLGRVVQINADGSIDHVIVEGLPNAIGIAYNPANGHAFVSYDGHIADVDPASLSAATFADGNYDGLTLSADGSTLYAARSDGHIIGLDSTDAGVVFDSGSIGGTPDGTAEGTGPLAGNLFVNTNNGRIVEVDLATHAQTVVASNGSRGDFIKV